jgi:hypothetical protein
MPRKTSRLRQLNDRIAVARRIVDEQRALLKKLRAEGLKAEEVEAALRTYGSALAHLLAHQQRMKFEAKAKRGETLKKKPKKLATCPSR